MIGTNFDKYNPGLIYAVLPEKETKLSVVVYDIHLKNIEQKSRLRKMIDFVNLNKLLPHSPFNPVIKSYQLENGDNRLQLKIALSYETSFEILQNHLDDFGKNLAFLLSVIDPEIRFSRELINLQKES